MRAFFQWCLLLLIICVVSQQATATATATATTTRNPDNRDQCTMTFSGIVCYPVDCCGQFVRCENGVLYPPQV